MKEVVTKNLYHSLHDFFSRQWSQELSIPAAELGQRDKWAVTTNGHNVSFRGDKSVLKLNCGYSTL